MKAPQVYTDEDRNRVLEVLDEFDAGIVVDGIIGPVALMTAATLVDKGGQWSDEARDKLLGVLCHFNSDIEIDGDVGSVAMITMGMLMNGQKMTA